MSGRKKTQSWTEYFKSFAPGFQGGNLSALYAAGTALASGNYGAAAGAVAGLADKHYQLKQLTMEVNDAIYYIQNVKRWLSKTRTCNEADIGELVTEIEAFIHKNFISSTGFFAALKEADKRAMEALANMKTDRAGTIRRAQQFFNDTLNDAYTSMWPEYYRADLAFHMVRLIELVKDSMMQAMLKKTTRGSSSCRAKPKPLKLAKEAFTEKDVLKFVSPSSAAAGGRSTTGRRRRASPDPTYAL